MRFESALQSRIVQIMFRVPSVDHNWTGFRSTEVSVYSSTMPLDHTREDYDLHPSVNLGIIKFLGI